MPSGVAYFYQYLPPMICRRSRLGAQSIRPTGRPRSPINASQANGRPRRHRQEARADRGRQAALGDDDMSADARSAFDELTAKPRFVERHRRLLARAHDDRRPATAYTAVRPTPTFRFQRTLFVRAKAACDAFGRAACQRCPRTLFRRRDDEPPPYYMNAAGRSGWAFAGAAMSVMKFCATTRHILYAAPAA